MSKKNIAEVRKYVVLTTLCVIGLLFSSLIISVKKSPGNREYNVVTIPLPPDNREITFIPCPEKIASTLVTHDKWNIYIDKDLGLSFCYPANLIVDGSTVPLRKYSLKQGYRKNISGWIDISASSADLIWDEYGTGMDINRYVGPTIDLSLSDADLIVELKKNLGATGPVHKLERIKLGGRDALSFYVIQYAPDGGASLTHEIIVPLKGLPASNLIIFGPVIAAAPIMNAEGKIVMTSEEVDSAVTKYFKTGDLGILEKADCRTWINCITESEFQDFIKSFSFIK